MLIFLNFCKLLVLKINNGFFTQTKKKMVNFPNERNDAEDLENKTNKKKNKNKKNYDEEAKVDNSLLFKKIDTLNI